MNGPSGRTILTLNDSQASKQARARTLRGLRLARPGQARLGMTIEPLLWLHCSISGTCARALPTCDQGAPCSVLGGVAAKTGHRTKAPKHQSTRLGTYKGTSPIRNRPPSYDPPRTLGIGLLQNPGGVRFLTSDVPLYSQRTTVKCSKDFCLKVKAKICP